MDNLPPEILTRILWHCVPERCGSSINLANQIWPVVAVCKRWDQILTDPNTIPIGFGRVNNLGLILFITKQQLTVDRYQEHFDPETFIPSFYAMYQAKKWQRYAPFLIPRLSHFRGPQHDINYTWYTWTWCLTADSLFHVFRLSARPVTRYAYTMIFGHIIDLVARGHDGYQLKHVNWCYKILLNGDGLHYWYRLDYKRIFPQLIMIGFPYRRIRLLFLYVFRDGDTYITIKPKKMIKAVFIIINCYYRLASMRLARRRTIDRIKEEVNFYHTYLKESRYTHLYQVKELNTIMRQWKKLSASSCR